MTINCKGNLIDLSSPKIMGILNITPDSFYDGGAYKNEKDILVQTEKCCQKEPLLLMLEPTLQGLVLNMFRSKKSCKGSHP